MMISTNAVTAEKDLIERAKVNKQAFLEIYDAHFQKIYDYAYYRTMSRVEAEEITSQTFLAAIESIQRYEYRNIPVAVWLYKIASNAISDLYRKKGRTVELELNEHQIPADALYEPEKIAVENSEKKQLLESIRALPLLQQQAIILRYIQNLPYKDIAEILEKSEGAVKQLLHRGLTSLRERMVHHEE